MVSFAARMARAAAIALAVLVTTIISPRVIAQAPADADAKLAAHWVALASLHDDETAAAIDALAAEPDATLALVSRKLGPLTDLASRIRELVIQLRAAKFADREQAQQQLEAYGALAEPELRRLHAAGLPLEAKTRVEQLLALRFGPYAVTPHDWRLARLIHVLERIDEPQARNVLTALEPVRDLPLITPRVGRLYQQLYSQEPVDRGTAAVELLAHPTEAVHALPRFIELLGDVNHPLVTVGNHGQRVADHVADSLPKLGPQIVPPLIDALDHANHEVRQRVVALLGQMHDERAVAPLVARLEKGDKECISELVHAIGGFGTAATAPLLAALETTSADNRGYVIGALAETRDPAVIPVIALRLRDADPLMRQWAISSLEKLQEPAIDSLIAAFRDMESPLHDDPKGREAILFAVCRFEDPRVAALVVEALQDHQPGVRAHAFYRITHLNRDALRDPAVVEIIMAALHDASPQVRRAATQLTGSAARSELHTVFDPQQVNAALLAALAEDDPDMRIAAAAALGSRHCIEAVAPLIEMLDDDRSGEQHPLPVQLAAAEALGEIGDARARQPLLNLLEAKAEQRVIRALGQLRDRAAVPALLELLKADDPEIRYAAVEALGELKDPRAVEPLIVVMRAGEPTPRTLNPLVDATVRALGEIGDPRAIPALIELTRKPDTIVERFGGSRETTHGASQALRNMGLPAIPHLAAALSDEAPSTREAAASALHSLYIVSGSPDEFEMQPALEPLAAALNDPSRQVQFDATLTLGALGDKRAAPRLLEFVSAYAAPRDDNSEFQLVTRDETGGFEVEPYMMMNIAGYLSRIHDPETIPPLIALLSDNRPPVRACAARALGYMRAEQAVEPLLALLDDGAPSLRVEAASALGRMKNRDTVERVIKVLADGSPDVRAAAAEALGRIGGAGVDDALAPLLNDSSPAVCIAAAMALVHVDDARGLPAVTRIIAAAEGKEREQAFAYVGSSAFAPRASLTPILIDALDEPTQQASNPAAYALGRIATDDAIEGLIAHIEIPGVRTAILQALGGSKHQRAYPVLVARLDDADSYTRRVAAEQLGRSERLEFAAALLEHLNDPDREVRLAVINALTTLKATSAVPQLTAALDDEDPQVARAAARAVERLKP